MEYNSSCAQSFKIPQKISFLALEINLARILLKNETFGDDFQILWWATVLEEKDNCLTAVVSIELLYETLFYDQIAKNVMHFFLSASFCLLFGENDCSSILSDGKHMCLCPQKWCSNPTFNYTKNSGNWAQESLGKHYYELHISLGKMEGNLPWIWEEIHLLRYDLRWRQHAQVPFLWLPFVWRPFGHQTWNGR